MNTSVKCAVCGNESYHKFNGSTKTVNGTFPDKIKSSTLSYWVQRCPHCGYCSPDLSELINGADEQIASEEYQAQLTNKKFPKLANSFLCAGLLHECAEEFDKAGWDCLHAALFCDDKENNEAAVYCRKRAYSMFIEAMDSGQKFEDSPSKERVLLVDIARRAGVFEPAEEK